MKSEMPMEIKFTVDAEELNKALNVVSIVTPLPVTADRGAGFLFSVRPSEQRCYIYSRDSKNVTRSSFPISDIEGEGAFIYPAQYIEGFKYVEGAITMTAYEKEGAFKVKYVRASGKEGSDRNAFDPRMMQTFEKELQKAESTKSRTFNIKTLQRALSASKPFIGSDKAEERYKSVQIFGTPPELAPNEKTNGLDKANGNMFASNGVTAFYFHCETFMDNDLTVSGAHLSPLESFISKSSGELSVYDTDNLTYAKNDKGDVFGWTKNSEKYTKFAYYVKNEALVLQLDRDKVLHELQYIRAELERSRDKIRFHFSAADESIHFSIADENSVTSSLPVSAHKTVASPGKDITANCNVDNLITLFQSAIGTPVEFRVMILEADAKRAKTSYMFRTIDTFRVHNETGDVVGVDLDTLGEDNVQEGLSLCQVTRYAPGKD
jgi:hypothetical protein